MSSNHDLRQSKSIVVLTLIGLLGMAMTSSAAAQQQSNIIESSERSMEFDCEPGSVPETSMLERFREDVRKVVSPDEYEEKYPDECITWSKSYLVEAENGDVKSYTVNVVKYKGEDQPALVSVVRGGKGVAYTGLAVNGTDVGSTNSDGRYRTKMSDDFKLTVETSDAKLRLYGN